MTRNARPNRFTMAGMIYDVRSDLLFVGINFREILHDLEFSFLNLLLL